MPDNEEFNGEVAQGSVPVTPPTTEQWTNFLGSLAAQNDALSAQLAQSQSHNLNVAVAQREAQINALPAEEKVKVLQGQLDNIKNIGTAVQQQQFSNSVWQRRDADAAAQILQMHGLTGNEASLYHGEWDVNWLPRFTNSVNAIVQSKKTQAKNNPANNPANRANISNGQPLPEIADNATGYDTIRFALARMRG